MAYSGTTAGTTSQNPPMLIAGKVGGVILNMGSTVIGTAKGQGAQLWFYACTETSTGLLPGTPYFTDGDRLGMKVGDVVIMVSHTGGATMNLGMFAITSGSTAGYGFSTGAMITSTFG